MLMHPQNIPDIPQQTVDVARASFPSWNIYMQIRDTLGSIFDYYTFVNLFPTNGQPAYAPWRLALVCIMQFMENLSDRQAADAVRGHIDWKYILSLPLTDPGFDYSILSEFRTRLLTGGAEHSFTRYITNPVEGSRIPQNSEATAYRFNPRFRCNPCSQSIGNVRGRDAFSPK
jgi:transposase